MERKEELALLKEDIKTVMTGNPHIPPYIKEINPEMILGLMISLIEIIEND